MIDVLIPVALFAAIVAWRLWVDFRDREPAARPDPPTHVRRVDRPYDWSRDGT